MQHWHAALKHLYDTGTQGNGDNQTEVDYIYNESKVVEFARDSQTCTSLATNNAFALTYTRGVTAGITHQF